MVKKLSQSPLFCIISSYLEVESGIIVIEVKKGNDMYMRKGIKLGTAMLLAAVLFFEPHLSYIVRAEEDIVSGGDALNLGVELFQGEEPVEEETKGNEEAELALQDILKDRVVMALVYLSDEYPLRTGASYDSETIVNVPSGQQVQIQNVVISEGTQAWEYVKLYYGEQLYEGYIPRSNLACSDEVFLEWESEYNMNPQPLRLFNLRAAAEPYYADIAQFPESYQAALIALKTAHPNWTFVKMNTNLDWNYVVSQEMVGARSLIPSSFASYMQNGLYGTSWAYASQDTLKYYLDPRNGLTENNIFQFELLTYNASYHTEAAVQSFLNNTFMSGIAPGTSMTFAHIFWAIGKEQNVSPFHLACRVYQEQGKGTSPLISGTYPGYVGYYNYFNISASGKTNEEIYISGLTKAKEQGWTDAYFSILGGSKVISANYILKGQDTLYLQKFDVDNSYDGMFWHQYMQNICAPTSEGQNVRKLYVNANSLENTFVFKIPVYNNMPSTACPLPTVSYTVAVTPPTGYTNANIYLDGVEYAATSQEGQYLVTAPNGNAKTAVMYKYNEAGVPIGMYVWSLSHNGVKYEATAVPGLEDLLSYHGFSIRIVGKSGIRFKTGISSSVKQQLKGTGVAGYTLKEYGTLSMSGTNKPLYPFVKGGTKVLSGMAYGKNSSGTLEDLVYETVSGRQRFTSVLVGLPASQYKTEFAFRGYITLVKDGAEITLYGPSVQKSIYSIAQLMISEGKYDEGSSVDLFLRQLIIDADNLE